MHIAYRPVNTGDNDFGMTQVNEMVLEVNDLDVVVEVW